MQGAAVIPFSRFSAWADMLRDARLADDWQAVEMVEAMLRQQDILASLQSDGWWLRSAIVWAKGLSFCPTYSGSVMPESVRDRPTSAYEMVFLLTKRARYYYDADAVREALQTETAQRYKYRFSGQNELVKTGMWHKGKDGNNNLAGSRSVPAGRNLRNVWAINPAGFPGAHFATFPPALVEPCIKAGTSERGCCPACGAPWERVTAKTGEIVDRWSDYDARAAENGNNHKSSTTRAIRTTLGWRPGCECDGASPWPFGNKPIIEEQLPIALPLLAEYEQIETIPATVCDIFGGAGTTALVARQLGRDAILIELSEEYVEMTRRRLDGTEEIEAVDHNGDEVTMEQARLFSSVVVE
jgi:DNA modification methylase